MSKLLFLRGCADGGGRLHAESYRAEQNNDSSGPLSHSRVRSVVAKLDEKHAAPRSMLGDLQKVGDTGEAGSPSQVRRDVGEGDLVQLRHHDMARSERISAADFYVWSLPKPNGAGDLAFSDAVSQRRKKLHSTRPGFTAGRCSLLLRRRARLRRPEVESRASPRCPPRCAPPARTRRGPCTAPRARAADLHSRYARRGSSRRESFRQRSCRGYSRRIHSP